MPLPKPQSGEDKEEFISRCMADEESNKEFPDDTQRAGYCFGAWEEREEVFSVAKRLRLEGYVGEDITPQSVSEMLDGLSGEDIIVDLYTTGGIIWEGTEIHNRIAEYSGKKTVIMGGLVASIGAYIAAAFDTIQAKDLSAFFMHNAQSIAIGDSRTMKKEAEELERLNERIAEVWSKRNGRPVEEIKEIMANETWYYGQEIVDAGFADELIETGRSENRENAIITAEHKVNKAKAQYMQRVAMAKPADLPDGGEANNTEERTMDKKEVLNFLKANGEITLREIAQSMGKENMIVTDAHTAAVETVEKLNGLLGAEDLLKETERLKVRENAATLLEHFGPEKSEDGRENTVRLYANEQAKNGVKIEDIKNSAVYKALKASSADFRSDQNTVVVEDNNNPKPTEGDSETLDY